MLHQAWNRRHGISTLPPMPLPFQACRNRTEVSSRPAAERVTMSSSRVCYAPEKCFVLLRPGRRSRKADERPNPDGVAFRT
jgi:hypothetical protein